MSDDYIRSLSLKYRLAVAIAVLKDKPQDISVENYIEDLKSKINNENIDDLDLTVCSDDFDVGENFTAEESGENVNTIEKHTNGNSITILKDYNVQLDSSMDILDNRKCVRQETLQNLNLAEKNPNDEAQLNTQETIHFTQRGLIPDSQLTFCETNTQNNFILKNVLENDKYDTIFNINEAIETDKVNLDAINKVYDTNQTYYDSQATELYTLHGYTQNYTHVSQSQNYEQIIISDKYLKTKNNIHNTTNTNRDNDNRLKSNSPFSNTANNNQDITKFCNNAEISEDINSKDKNGNIIGSNVIVNEQNENTNVNSMEINESFSQHGQDFNEIDITENTIHTIGKPNLFEEIQENDDNPSNESQIVSFKVVEELNKIKNYLNKKFERRMSNDCSMDSGYRSDTPSKCSFRSSLQMSGNWLNQSAHSLYEYITQCPLLSTTHEIIGEIAQVLGQLIDRLHEEEKYPSFLDELLENISLLLQELFQESGGEDLLLRKDDNIQRLILLNKSTHIQKYTIEKITNILENVLSYINNSEKTYELENITEIENTSYIFHLLEVILQIYLKEKDMNQDITNSQVESKKSSITELWKRKWNPNYKENTTQDFTPKKCVLIKCNEVLNKLVIACMDGYSLIAFAALSCFNMLQS